MTGINKEVVTSKIAPQPLGTHSVEITVTPGEILYASGQLSVNPNGNFISNPHAALQKRQALDNIGQYVADTGDHFSNMVELTTYLVGCESIPGYLQGRGEVYSEIYPDSDFQANTLLAVSILIH